MRFVLAFSLAALLGLSAHADEKKTPAAPSQEQQVMTLVNSVQNDLKPEKRAEAAKVLHQFDGTAFPEIASVLIQVLERDSDPGVRKEAAKSLGRVKPTSGEALDALNRAAEKDAVLKVRMAARMARLGYRAPPPPPSAPLPQAPEKKWSLTFWKKKPAPAPQVENPPPVVTKSQAPAQLPKPPHSDEGPILLPPPAGNPKD